MPDPSPLRRRTVRPRVFISSATTGPRGIRRLPRPTDQVHVVAKGDTLWQIAAKYYGNPYLWPQIWEKNQYIMDAHWIYPGDPLVLGLNVAPVQNLSQGGAGGDGTGQTGAPTGEAAIPAPPAGVVDAARATGTPVPLGAETDIYCQGYVGDLDEPFPYAVIGSEYDALSLDGYVRGATGWKVGSFRSSTNTTKVGLTMGDIIYVDGGRERGLLPGKLFSAVDRRAAGGASGPRAGGGPLLPLRRPRPRPLGPGEHRDRRDRAVLRPAQRRRPALPLRARAGAARPQHRLAAGQLPGRGGEDRARSRDRLLPGRHPRPRRRPVVHIDLGEQDTTPGDIFTIYRENRPGLPPIVMGELAVLSVHKRFSVAKIIESRYPIKLGDRLDPK